MTLPASVEYVIIHCGTNNFGHKSPLKIAKGLIDIACMLSSFYRLVQSAIWKLFTDFLLFYNLFQDP